jgi:hypothetical protein
MSTHNNAAPQADHLAAADRRGNRADRQAVSSAALGAALAALLAALPAIGASNTAVPAECRQIAGHRPIVSAPSCVLSPGKPFPLPPGLHPISNPGTVAAHFFPNPPVVVSPPE